MLKFRRASQVPNDNPWRASLMQVTRTGIKLACELDYHDAERWDVTPSKHAWTRCVQGVLDALLSRTNRRASRQVPRSLPPPA
jgi:hypothetical protein